MKRITVILDRTRTRELETVCEQTGLPVSEVVRWALRELHDRGPHDPVNVSTRSRLQSLLASQGSNLALFCQQVGVSRSVLENVLWTLQEGVGGDYREGSQSLRVMDYLNEHFPEILGE